MWSLTVTEVIVGVDNKHEYIYLKLIKVKLKTLTGHLHVLFMFATAAITTCNHDAFA